MRVFDRDGDRNERRERGGDKAPEPGKVSGTEHLPAVDSSATPRTSPQTAADVARQGVASPGRPLPHRDAIQQLFGRHDVHNVSAHIGGEAAASSRSLNAQAYAVGNDVAFRAEPDLHTAAHEAAHVVQQRQGVQLKGGIDGGAGDPYERQADAVADLVVAGRSAEALLGTDPGRTSSPAAVQRKEDDSKPAAVGKVEYVHSHLGKIVEGARATLSSQQIATFSKYASWTGTAFAGSVAKAALTDGLDVGHLQALLQPASVYDIADRARVRAQDKDGGITDHGKPDWQPAVGTAVGAALTEKLTESVKRMMPRYLDARYQALLAEEKASGVCKEPPPEASAADITPSHPLDSFTINAMCSGIVTFVAGYRATVKDDKPLFRKPERVKFTWDTISMGAYWIVVTGRADADGQLKAGADATAEDVALTLFGTPAEAHEVVVAAPRFGFTHAYKLLKPHQDYVTSKGEDVNLDADPTKMLLAAPGGAADSAALAQSTGAQSGKSSQEIAGKLRESLTILDTITTLANKLGATVALDDARGRIDKHSQEFAKPDANFAEVSKWENHTWLQAAVLSRVSFGLGSLDERLTAMTAGLKGVPPTFDKLNLPQFTKNGMKGVAQTFVDAAAISHLPTTADAKAAEGDRQNRMLPAEILEGVLTDVLRTIDDTRRSKKEFNDYHPNFYPGPYKADPNDVKRMEEQEATLRKELATLRATLLNDPLAAADAFKRIQEEVLDLQTEAMLVGSADELDRLWIQLEQAVFRSPMPSMGGPLASPNPLWDKISKLQKEALGYRSRWESTHAKLKAGDQAGAKKAVDDFRADPRLPVFLGEVGQAITDSYAIEAINKITMLLGITLITMGVGAWVGGIAAGLELGTGATILTVSAAEAATFTLLSQAVLDSDHSVKHIAGEFLFNFGMFAALRTFSRMLEAAKLAEGVATATEMSGQAVILGASTYAKERFIEKGRPLTEAEVKQLCIEGVVMFVAIAIIGRVASPILKELEGAGRGLGAKILAANEAATTVGKMATALKGSPGDVAKALETIAAERDLMKARLAAYEALEARMAEEAKTPPKKGESVFDKTGLTPDRVAEIKAALGKAQAEMKAAETMLTLESIAPDTYACPKERIAAVLKELGTPASTTEDPVTKAKTYTVKSPDGKMVRIVERVQGPDSKLPEASGAPQVDTSHLPEGSQSIERWQTKGINDDKPDLWATKAKDGRLFKDVYAEWMRQAERIKQTGDSYEPIYPESCPPEFKPFFDAIVRRGNITLTTQGQANVQKLKDAGIELDHLDPTTPEYMAKRPKIIEILGEKAVLQWETTKLGDGGRSKVSERIHKVLSDDALAQLRAAFPDCEIIVSGSATQTGKELSAVKDIDVVLVVPEGTSMNARIGLEKRAAGMSVRSSPDLVKAGGPKELKVDAKAMTQAEYMGMRTVVTGRTPMEDTRIDSRPSADAATFVETLRARLNATELEKLELMTGGKKPKTPEEIQKMFEGRLADAIRRIRESVAKDVVQRKVKADSKLVKEELEARIQRESLMQDPEIQKLIDSIKPDDSNLADVIKDIRGKLAGEIAARNAEAAHPEAEVLRDVKIWIEYPETDIPTWRANHPEMKPEVVVQVKNGKVHLLSTDIDVLVITPREPGKPSKVIERQEVKSGTNDTFSDAKDQLLKQKKRLGGEFDGGTGVLVENKGKDITGDIDLSSDASAKMTAIGPAGKDGFSGSKDGVKGETSKITGSDMEALVKELVKLEQDARAAKAADPTPTDASSGTPPP